MQKASIAIIGAGWAGCSAAVELARRGARVTLIEAARTAGGRARRVEQDGRTLDNGQHILLGAYRDTLHMMRTVGISPARAMLRLPLQMRYPKNSNGMDFIAPRLPAPFHLLWAMLRAKGLSAADKLALTKFTGTARWMGWRLDVDCSVSELLERFEQTDTLIRLMWRPLCIAALNTLPERASARVFLRVLGDSLGAARSASDMLLPAEDLSALFPDAAIAYLEKHHGKTQLGVRIRSLTPVDNQWHLSGDGYDEQFSHVIVATAAHAAQDLLSPIDAAWSDRLAFDYEPITTCYLQYEPSFRLGHAMLALHDDPELGHWGQYVFDRGQLDSSQAGLLAVVISASSQVIQMDQSSLVRSIALQLSQVFSRSELAEPSWSQVITEKRATFACTPDLQRPGNETALARLWLAGDYTDGPFPATIEGAVRSGLQAAGMVVQQLDSAPHTNPHTNPHTKH